VPAARVAIRGNSNSPGAAWQLPVSEVRDNKALLRWLAAHHGQSRRLLDRSLLPDSPGWKVANDGGSASGSSSAQQSYVAPKAAAGTMPDVTHDGVDDVFQVNYGSRKYIVRDGRTGRVLWQRNASGFFDAEYARLGSPARPALVVQTFSSTGGVDRAGVAALDAGTGKVLWSTDAPASGVDLPVGFGDVNDTYLAGVSTGHGPADEVVIGTITGVASLAGATAAVTPGSLDGATGTLVARGVPLVADDLPWVSALGDVTGDGVGDIAVTANGNERQVALYDGATGARRWLHTTPDGSQFGSYSELLPRADSGRPAVLVNDGGFGGGAVTAYGSGGKVLWTVAGMTGEVVADSDRDRIPDVIGIGFTDTGFEVVGISGRTGTIRFRTGIAMPETTNGDASLGGGLAGDLTGDGVTDVLFTRDATGTHPVHDVIVIDGRTGRQHTDRQLRGLPLGARLSGRGDALLDVTATDTRVTLTARTLQQKLWTRRLSARRVIGPAFLDYGRLTTSTRTADILASLYGYTGSDIIALNGTTGAVLWRTHV
jgi:hypothetical protein